MEREESSAKLVVPSNGAPQAVKLRLLHLPRRVREVLMESKAYKAR